MRNDLFSTKWCKKGACGGAIGAENEEGGSRIERKTLRAQDKKIPLLPPPFSKGEERGIFSLVTGH
jgi:hypothetical protein